MNTIKMMNIIIMLLSTNLIFACNMKENDCNLQQFIGPKPGYKSIFIGNIFPLELKGLSKDNNGIFEVE